MIEESQGFVRVEESLRLPGGSVDSDVWFIFAGLTLFVSVGLFGFLAKQQLKVSGSVEIAQFSCLAKNALKLLLVLVVLFLMIGVMTDEEPGIEEQPERESFGL